MPKIYDVKVGNTEEEPEMGCSLDEESTSDYAKKPINTINQKAQGKYLRTTGG